MSKIQNIQSPFKVFLDGRGVSTLLLPLDIKLSVHLLIGHCKLWVFLGKEELCLIYIPFTSRFLSLRITIMLHLAWTFTVTVWKTH